MPRSVTPCWPERRLCGLPLRSRNNCWAANVIRFGSHSRQAGHLTYPVDTNSTHRVLYPAGCNKNEHGALHLLIVIDDMHSRTSKARSLFRRPGVQPSPDRIQNSHPSATAMDHSSPFTDPGTRPLCDVSRARTRHCPRLRRHLDTGSSSADTLPPEGGGAIASPCNRSLACSSQRLSIVISAQHSSRL